MDDGIIDLPSWAAEREERRRTATFAVWGGEGERSRFALPVWRSVYILGGVRGAVLWTDASGELRPFFVLDLGAEPARTDFPSAVAGLLEERDPPALVVEAGVAAVLLATTPERRWLLVVVGEEVGEEDPDPASREDLLFLAGECAGLLMHRGLGEDL